MGEASLRWVWTPKGLQRDRRVRWSAEGRVLAVEAATGPVSEGLLLPGLVNAHTHLELSGLAGRVPGGQGSVAWVQTLSAIREDPDQDAIFAAAASARAAGCAALIDVSNGGDTAAAMGAAGLRGGVLVELIGLSPARFGPRLDAAWAPAPGGLPRRPTAHSPISCSPALLVAALADRPRDRMAPTVHCDEDPDDRLLLGHRRGAWAGFHDRLAAFLPDHAWREGLCQAPSGVAALSALGLLGPHLGLVHLVAADAADLDAVARAGSTAVLCPRSNLHIGGRLPDVAGLVARGVPLAIGTDSLASSPDLDLLAEAAALSAAFPDLPAALWIRAMTEGGAALLADSDLGAIRPGARPGLLRIDLPATGAPLAALLSGQQWPRGWLA